MSNTYNPQEGSVAYRVIEFFTTNPDEQLTKHDLEAKFDKPANQFHSILGAAVHAGVLNLKANDDDELTYSLGSGTPNIKRNPVRHPSAKPDALELGAALGQRSARSKKTKPAPLDFDAIELVDNAPLPEKRGETKAKWLDLFNRMQVNQSCHLPTHTKTTVAKYIQATKAEGKGTFVIRQVDDKTIGLWRTA